MPISAGVHQKRTGALLLAFDAAGADLSGTIVQDDSNSPVPSAALRIQNTRGSVVAETETDAEGRFRVSLLEEGKYYLGAEKRAISKRAWR